ncbi:TetR/AcrR family transcriptional regulator [Kitasatospora sp. NBC_00240]|uniref:TetR/AcrR family transcriptional regulator n=1 Tax=Kitasatospora sp. NBC_00240 TaxID=2903567 RepID=UPI00224CB920|nr:TetR/AcrR family transcriptional regulator [Kitasatospora sp. NBC_00240]MCX5208838.1 TetR/AcrR family transcriptional regulator [Kitasatospora sp. NBC_00240]
MTRSYHHGNLRAALVDAGVALARTGGPSAVVLRSVSRQAGVSHNAAYRHFTDHQDLLAAVAARCTEQLGQLMATRTAAAAAGEPLPRAWSRLEAIGRAYVDFARTEPGWFRTAFSGAGAHRTPEQAGPTPAVDPYLLLAARLDELVEVGALPADRRPGAEYAAWSAVHGLSTLLLDGPLRDLPDAEIHLAVTTVLSVIARGL